MKRLDTHRGGKNHHIGKRISGANYRKSCGACTVPPWELCGCSSAELLSLNARIVAPVRIERIEKIERSIVRSYNDEADERFNFVLQE